MQIDFRLQCIILCNSSMNYLNRVACPTFSILGKILDSYLDSKGNIAHSVSGSTDFHMCVK